MVQLRPQADQLQQLGRGERRVTVAGRNACGESDVLETCEVRQQVSALEHVGDPVGAQRAAGGGVERRKGPSAPLDRARRRLDEPAEQMQQRRLAGAGAPEQRQTVLLVDRQIDSVQRSNGRLPLAVSDHDSPARRQHVLQTALPSRSSITRSTASATRGE